MTSKIDNLTELDEVLCNIERVNEGVLGFFKQFKINDIFKHCADAKTKGISAKSLIACLALFRLHGISIWAMQKLGNKNLLKADDNTFYRLMNNPLMPWRKLLMGFAKQFKTIADNNSTEDNRIRCFVIDDTDIEKTGITIEFISRIFNHVTKKYILGFKLLALGYWDGKSLITVDFSLHREKGSKGNFGLNKKEKKAQFSKARDTKSPSKSRVKELDMKKTEVAISMIKRAVKNGFSVTYVLMDSWFTNDYIIKSIRSIKSRTLHLVGMCKMDNRKYTIQGQELNANQMIIKFERKCKKYSRKYKSQYIPLVAEYKGEKVKLFFVLYGKSTNWNLLLTTDLSLKFTQAIEIYQIRWTIEVLFKECKQYLRLGSCQNTDFDGQIADATIMFITHTILTLQKRFEAYETTGELFRETQQKLIELTLWHRILKIFTKMLQQLMELLNIDIEETLSKLMSDDKSGKQIIAILSLLRNDEDNDENIIKNAA